MNNSSSNAIVKVSPLSLDPKHLTVVVLPCMVSGGTKTNELEMDQKAYRYLGWKHLISYTLDFAHEIHCCCVAF